MTVTGTTWRGLPAVALAGGGRTAVVGLVGGHLASLRFDDEAVEPLWQPHWPAADPAMGSDLSPYGEGPDAPLLAVACGSFLCADHLGPPPAGSGGSTHGPAAIATYEVIASEPTSVTIRAALPHAALVVERSWRWSDAVLVAATTVRHAGAAPRAIDWCEHTTLGGPWLDEAVITATVDRVAASSAVPFTADPAAVAEALAMPPETAAPMSRVAAATVAGAASAAWWRVESPRCRRRLTCAFAADEWPWLTVWTEHHARQVRPWQGRERARGMELSSRPFPDAVDPPPGMVWPALPRRVWLPPHGHLTKTIHVHWERW